MLDVIDPEAKKVWHIGSEFQVRFGPLARVRLDRVVTVVDAAWHSRALDDVRHPCHRTEYDWTTSFSCFWADPFSNSRAWSCSFFNVFFYSVFKCTVSYFDAIDFIFNTCLPWLNTNLLFLSRYPSDICLASELQFTVPRQRGLLQMGVDGKMLRRWVLARPAHTNQLRM